MAKLQSLTLIPLLCLISAVAVAVHIPSEDGNGESKTFQVLGKVYCDTCRAGFVTTKTEYIAGAKVKMDCHNRTTHKLTFGERAETDLHGSYSITVPGEHEDDVCEVVLVSSPMEGCNEIKKPLHRARVMLTHNNGISTDTRFANALGFMKDKPLDGCSDLLAQYVLSDDIVF